MSSRRIERRVEKDGQRKIFRKAAVKFVKQKKRR
jgi:hypothetical protein